MDPNAADQLTEGVRENDVGMWKISCRLASCLNQIAAEDYSEIAARMKESAMAMPDKMTSLILCTKEPDFHEMREDLRALVAENNYLLNFFYREGVIGQEMYCTAIKFLSHLEGYLHSLAFRDLR